MKCAVYCRVSTEEQAAEGHSIEAQRQELVRYCHAMDLEIFDFYIDAGFSAASMERPALQKMLEESDKFDVVLVWRLDRISRDMSDLMKILEIFQNNNVAFKSKTENFDTSTASGKLMLNMLGSFAEFERASISERIKMAHRKILNEGKWRGGPPPFGYRLTEGKTLAVDEEEAKAVRLIFEWSAEKNLGARAISVELNKLGFRGRKQKPFTGSYITKILKNPTYHGSMIHGRQRYIKKGGKKQVVYENEYDVHKGLFDPIVPEEVFLKSAQNMRDRKLNRGLSGSIPNPVGGLIYCGACKEYMLRNVRADGERFFVCRRYKHYGGCSHHYISEDRILKEIKKATARMEMNKEELLEMARRAAQEDQQQKDKLRVRIEGLAKQIRTYSSREDTLFELMEKRLISEEEFVKRKRRLAEQREQSGKVLAELKEKLEESERGRENKHLTGDIKGFNEEFDNLTPMDQKRVLQSLIARIEVMDSEKPYQRKQVHIYFKI